MVPVLLVMLSGIIIGLFINRFPRLIKTNEKLISLAIYVLLFLLGISVGLNKTIMQNLDKIGVQSIIITAGSVTGSVLALWILYHYFFESDQNGGGQHEK